MNSGKCHLFVSVNKYKHMLTNVGHDKKWESRTVKLLGKAIDNELKIDEHVSNLFGFWIFR